MWASSNNLHLFPHQEYAIGYKSENQQGMMNHPKVNFQVTFSVDFSLKFHLQHRFYGLGKPAWLQTAGFFLASKLLDFKIYSYDQIRSLCLTRRVCCSCNPIPVAK
ncbi:hypothetical protein U1Q18_018853 [Sarracenia purpurea var. burkii]